MKLTYSKAANGLLTRVEVDGASGQFSMHDRVYDDKVYTLHANSIRLLSSGPLMVVYETEGVYSGAPSKVKAVYRFTHYAGEPGARLTAKITQDYSKQYGQFFAQINFHNPPISHYTAGTRGGELDPGGTWARGNGWAAIYGEGILLGLCGTPNPAVWSPSGSPPASGYLASVTGDSFSSLSHACQCAIYFGAGSRDLPGLAEWNTVVSNTPVVKVTLNVLDTRITGLVALVEKRRERLSRLDGQK